MAAQQALQAATVPAYWSIGQVFTKGNYSRVVPLVFTGQGPRELFRTKRGGQIYKRYMRRRLRCMHSATQDAEA